MYTEIIPPVWPASPSLSPPWSSAALLSLHDASPARRNTHVLSHGESVPDRESGILPLTHDSFHEGDELLFFFLPLDEVSLYQSLQLCQILLLTLPGDVLPPNQDQALLEFCLLFVKFVSRGKHSIKPTHIKIHFFTIRDFWDGYILHKPADVNSLLLYNPHKALF